MVKNNKRTAIYSLITAFREVFRNFWYWIIAFVIFIGTLIFAIWLPNLSFLRHTVVSPDYNFSQKTKLLISSLEAINTNFTVFSQILTVIIALLFAINITLVIYHIKKRIVVQKSAGLGLAGILTGILGIGCASCGSVLLSSIFGFGATASFIGILPLRGQEFGLLSIIILGFSIFLQQRKLMIPPLVR